jgi:hypothetical protein
MFRNVIVDHRQKVKIKEKKQGDNSCKHSKPESSFVHHPHSKENAENTGNPELVLKEFSESGHIIGWTA